MRTSLKQTEIRREASRRYRQKSLERRSLTAEDRRNKELLGFDDLPLFGISFCRQHLYRLIKAGKFPKYVKIGGRNVAFVRDDILAWIEKVKTA